MRLTKRQYVLLSYELHLLLRHLNLYAPGPLPPGVTCSYRGGSAASAVPPIAASRLITAIGPLSNEAFGLTQGAESLADINAMRGAAFALTRLPCSNFSQNTAGQDEQFLHLVRVRFARLREAQPLDINKNNHFPTSRKKSDRRVSLLCTSSSVRGKGNPRGKSAELDKFKDSLAAGLIGGISSPYVEQGEDEQFEEESESESSSVAAVPDLDPFTILSSVPTEYAVDDVEWRDIAGEDEEEGPDFAAMSAEELEAFLSEGQTDLCEPPPVLLKKKKRNIPPRDRFRLRVKATF